MGLGIENADTDWTNPPPTTFSENYSVLGLRLGLGLTPGI